MKRPLPCPLCESSRYRTVHSKGAWRYLACAVCGLVRMDPMPLPEEAVASYQDYLSADAPQVARWEEMMRPVVYESAGLLEGHAPRVPGRLLEVGCGYGFFAGEMRARGWEVTGIEPSPQGRAHTASRYGITVLEGPLEAVDLAPSSFDAVTLFYVVEHLADPVGLLGRVRDLLVPGGLLLLRWPHTTPIVRILGPLAQRLDLYHTPFHLLDFSPGTMKRLLKKTGFNHVQTLPGAPTKPHRPLARWAAGLFGALARFLFRVSRSTLLLPGVSKTTLAFKPE